MSASPDVADALTVDPGRVASRTTRCPGWPRTRRRPMSRAHIRSHGIRLLACLSLAFLAGSTVEAAATTNPLDAIDTVTPGPLLTGAACTGEGQDVLMVIGEQFTPGGEVAVVLFMPDKADPAVIRALRASQSIV